MYLYVLLSGQRHASCLWLLHILTKFRPVISDDGLDACLIMNVHNKLLACFGKHCLRPNLKSLLAFGAGVGCVGAGLDVFASFCC